MFKKIILRKRIVLAALGAAAILSLTAAVRPKIQAIFYPDAAPVSAPKKQLPIYCVDTKGDKKVAVSFDAAWGEGRSGSKKEPSVSGKAPFIRYRPRCSIFQALALPLYNTVSALHQNACPYRP